MPAYAGIRCGKHQRQILDPACAGMTAKGTG